jgi:hypothetical protein
VSAVTRPLQDTGLIHQSRGKITILDALASKVRRVSVTAIFARSTYNSCRSHKLSQRSKSFVFSPVLTQ